MPHIKRQGKGTPIIIPRYLLLLLSHTGYCSIYNLHYTMMDHFPEDTLGRRMLGDYHNSPVDLKNKYLCNWNSDGSPNIFLGTCCHTLIVAPFTISITP